MAKKREIRNSTAEFLTFVAEGKENGIQVLYKDETIWATQKAMATLFDVGVPAIQFGQWCTYAMCDSIFQSDMVRCSGSKLMPTLTIGRLHRANWC